MSAGDPQEGAALQAPTRPQVGIPSPTQPAESRPTWDLDAAPYGQPIPSDDVAGALAGYGVDSQYAMSPDYGPAAQYAGAASMGGPNYPAGADYAVGSEYPAGPEYAVSMSAPVWDVTAEAGGPSLTYPDAPSYQLDAAVPGESLDQLDWGDWAMVAQPPQPLAPGSPDDEGMRGDAPPTPGRRMGSHARREDVEAFSEPPAPAPLPRTPPLGYPAADFATPDGQPPGPRPPAPPAAPSPPEPSLADLTADQYLLVARYAHLITGGPAVQAAEAGMPPMLHPTPPDQGATATQAAAPKASRRAQRKARKAAAVAGATTTGGPPAAPAPANPRALQQAAFAAPAPAVPPGRSGKGRGVVRFAVAGVLVIGVGVVGFLAAQHFLGSEDPNEPPAGTPTTTLALPAEVAGLPRVAGEAAATAVKAQLGYPLRNTPTLGTGAYGQTAVGPATFTAMAARSTGAPPARQFADYESRTGNNVGDPVAFGDITCAPVAKSKELAGGSVCLWSASQLRGQTFVLSAKPKKAAGITAELVAAMTAAGPATPRPSRTGQADFSWRGLRVGA